MDTHIELGLEAATPANQRIIVEVTPRLRKQMKDQGEDWSTPALKKKMKGKWVRVSGWLLFDIAHVDRAENTNPGDDQNWRATCWEIDPVTSIEVLAGAPPALAELKPAAFATIRRAHAAHVTSDPKAKKIIEERNKMYISKFDKKELEEKESEDEDRKKP